MSGSRKLVGLVVLAVSVLSRGVSGQFEPTCVSSYDVEGVECPGDSGGPQCPNYQNWYVCGSQCTATPMQEARFCEATASRTCTECIQEGDGDLIFRAHDVGSCLCQPAE